MVTVGKIVDILLVEDNKADAHLTQKAFAMGRVANKLHVVADGEQALAFLRQEGEYAEAPRPYLILLDLNMPKMDGREVLAIIKSDPDLMTIPIVILTTSEAERDIVESYRLHANCYITKPVQIGKFFEIVKTINQYWIGIVQLPEEG